MSCVTIDKTISPMQSLIFDFWLLLIRHSWRFEVLSLIWLPQLWTKTAQIIRLGSQSAGILHDVGNTTMIIRFMHAEFAPQLTNRQNRDFTAQLENLSTQIIQGQQMLSQTKVLEITFDAVEILEETLGFFKNHPLANQCTISTNFLSSFELRGSPSIFMQAVLNILLNSAQSISKQKYRQIEISLKKEASLGIVTINDNGPGFPRGYKVRFLSTSKDGGNGIGLWYSQKQLRENLFCTTRFTNSSKGGAQTELYFWKLQ